MAVILETDIEPSCLCIGPHHLAVGMNNRIWFYELNAGTEDEKLQKAALKSTNFLFDKEYLGNIHSVCLNAEYVSVLFEGKLHLHLVRIFICLSIIQRECST